MIESEQILNEFERRVNPYIDKIIDIDENSKTIHKHRGIYGRWTYSKLNPHLRICKYNPKNLFAKHFDAGYHPEPTTHRTIKTCMLYLNGEFEGGHTRFYEEKRGGKGDDVLKFSLKPVAGMCLIFNQNILHDGEEVISGLKYMMRTDIFYKAFLLKNNLLDKQKRALKIYSEAVQLEDDGNTEEALKKYKEAWSIDPDIGLLYH